MWETINYHKTTIFVIILIVLLSLVWLNVPEEELEDPYILTIDFDCREVLRDSSDMSTDIIRQCKELVEELEMKNAPKQSKRGT